MTEELEAIARRRAALRITETELLEQADVKKIRWWRITTGRTKSLDARLRVLRQVERTLDRLEAKDEA